MNYLLLLTLPVLFTGHSVAAPLCPPASASEALSTAPVYIDLAQLLRDRLAGIDSQTSIPKETAAILEQPLRILDVAERISVPIPTGPAPDPHATMPTRLAATLSRADKAVTEAFAGLGPEWKDRLRRSFPELIEVLGKGIELDEPDLTDTLKRAAADVDFAALGTAMDHLTGFLAPEFLSDVEQWAAGRPAIAHPPWLEGVVEGELLGAWETPAGAVIIGGKGPNYYSTPAALIIDLGGDDTYVGAAAAPPLEWAHGRITSTYPRVSMIIDFSGNDRYLATGPVAQGAAFMGVGLLADLQGNDVYSAGAVAQGAGIFGIGMLLDGGGDDIYRAGHLAQGAALFGEGILLDRSGNDLYVASRLAQGFGGPLGRGYLHDVEGDDYYRAGGETPSSYGTPGRYQAFSQGVGMGLRPTFPGGVGILRDDDGNDHYHGDNFSQGVGYFFGYGRLEDAGGDDRYRGGRYSQGAAAHLGVGLLIDRRGDDRYEGAIAANQGGAWDLSVAALVDLDGNDHYQAGDLSLGAAAQNAIGFFVDAAGEDRYLAPRHTLGYSGAADYEGGRNAGNIGAFFDCGGQDHYPADSPNRGNGIRSPTATGEYFFDQ